ncbi:MAG TPA: sulfite exporter TauE/SafE family protein [Allosphingosinicella sp.]|uniref:sulfite exporter TauE/SafE family protein n=1 Tax=Allosphingosinicella sp. TaxID=2823234 RepID=UPI002ED8862C
MIGLAALFLGVALLYAMVGFGGGSTYNALLVLVEADYRAIPTISLLCNIVVVSVGTWRFWKDRHVQWRRIWPLFALSVPMAWFGGRIEVAEEVFVGALALTLFVAGLALLWQPEHSGTEREARPSLLEPLVGGVLGFLSGLVGIGGGIFLAPVLHFLRWDRSKVIAGTCAAFILINSIAGLAGQLGKTDGYDRLGAIEAHWLLFPAVVIGGYIGSRLGSSILHPKYVRIATALLILFVSVNLGIRFNDMVGGPL